MDPLAVTGIWHDYWVSWLEALVAVLNSQAFTAIGTLTLVGLTTVYHSMESTVSALTNREAPMPKIATTIISMTKALLSVMISVGVGLLVTACAGPRAN